MRSSGTDLIMLQPYREMAHSTCGTSNIHKNVCVFTPMKCTVETYVAILQLEFEADRQPNIDAQTGRGGRNWFNSGA